VWKNLKTALACALPRAGLVHVMCNALCKRRVQFRPRGRHPQFLSWRAAEARVQLCA
jgi:hypothetical protein